MERLGYKTSNNRNGGTKLTEKKRLSELQERQIAEYTGGKTQPNSGGTKFCGGDVLTDKFFIEAKTVVTERNSYSIKKEILDKLKEQTVEQNKQVGVLAFRFDPYGEDYFVLRKRDFIEYFDYKEEKRCLVNH